MGLQSCGPPEWAGPVPSPLFVIKLGSESHFFCLHRKGKPAGGHFPLLRKEKCSPPMVHRVCIFGRPEFRREVGGDPPGGQPIDEAPRDGAADRPTEQGHTSCQRALLNGSALARRPLAQRVRRPGV